MKSVHLYASGGLRLRELPTPIPGESEKLVPIKVVCVCGSDLHWFAEAGIGDARL